MSDNGCNYVRASRHLITVPKFLEANHPKLYFGNQNIQWHINPHQASNFSRLWEAAVKSIKNLLHRVINQTLHTFEQYWALFAIIEAVLNSRPLCRINDPVIDHLTPGHL